MKIRPASFATDMIPLKGGGGVSSALSDKLARAAPEEDMGNRPIALSVELLRSARLLTDDGSTQPARTATALMRVGAVNLSVGRLWEGHVNALRLVNLYGSHRLKDVVFRLIEQGAFLGVWGADGDVPVTCNTTGEQLSGIKNFASGLGTVSHAVVTINSGPEVRLALVDVSDQKRAAPLAWNMEGMKATASGTFDFTNLPMESVRWIGEPGDYLKEPHFVGGVWRIAALQVGAAVGLLNCAASQLRSRGRMDAEAQKSRLMTALMRAWGGISLVERAANATLNPDTGVELIVGTSISARLLTEEIGLNAIRAVEQSIGLQHFSAGSETGRLARDLSVYLRQAARDALLQRAANVALGEEDNTWGIFE